MQLNNIFKSFSSFFDNTTQEQKEQNNESLNQGKELLNYEIMYKNQVIPHLKPLQLTSSLELSSIVENLENNISVNSNGSKVTNNQMSNLEMQFNQTLSEYSITYKALIENLMHNSNNQSNLKQYYGKNIKDSQGNYIYVNDYGFTHKYSTNTWNNKDNSCPNTSENINIKSLNNLLNGPNMGNRQACKIAGQNVKNIETNEIAWVDIKGFKHIYPEDVWNSKTNSCDIKPIQLSGHAYKNIPTDSPMEQHTECLRLNVDTMLWEKIQLLNNKLISLSEQLINELNQMKTADITINTKIKDKKNEVNEYIKQLDNNMREMNSNSFKTSYETIQGQEHYTRKHLTTIKYQYIIWLILTILLLLAILRAVYGGDEDMVSGLLVLIFIFILYYVLKILN